MAAVYPMPRVTDHDLYKLHADSPSPLNGLRASALAYSDGSNPELFATAQINEKALPPLPIAIDVRADGYQRLASCTASSRALTALHESFDRANRMQKGAAQHSRIAKTNDKEIQRALHRCSTRGWTVIDKNGNKVDGLHISSSTAAPSYRTADSNESDIASGKVESAPPPYRTRSSRSSRDTSHDVFDEAFAAARQVTRTAHEPSNAADTTLVDRSSRSDKSHDAQGRAICARPVTDISDNVTEWVGHQRQVTAHAFHELQISLQHPYKPEQTTKGVYGHLYVAPSDVSDIASYIQDGSHNTPLVGDLDPHEHVYHASPDISTIMRHIAKTEQLNERMTINVQDVVRPLTAERTTSQVSTRSSTYTIPAPGLAVFAEYKRVGKQLGDLLRLSVKAKDGAGDVRALLNQFFRTSLDASAGQLRKDDYWQKRSKIRVQIKNKLEAIERLMLQIYPIVEELQHIVQSSQCAEPSAVLEMIDSVLGWFTVDHVLNNYSGKSKTAISPVRISMSRRRSQDANDTVTRIWQAIRRERELVQGCQDDDAKKERRRSLQGVQVEDLVSSIGRRLERQFGRIYHVAVEAIRAALTMSVGFNDDIFPIKGILDVDAILESAEYHEPVLTLFGGHGEIEYITKDDAADNCDFLGTTYISVERAMEVYAQAIRADAAVWDENDKRILSLLDAKPGDNKQLENFAAMRLMIAQRKQAFDQWQSAILGRTSIVVCGTV